MYAETEKDVCQSQSTASQIDMNGWCLPRIIHFIVALQLAWPGKSIFITKYDYSDAHQRIVCRAMAQTITTLGALEFAYWRLTFGVSPNLATWRCFFKLVTDLANEISLYVSS